MKVLFIHEGRMNQLGCDLATEHMLLAMTEGGHEVHFLARGKPKTVQVIFHPARLWWSRFWN